MVTEAKWFSVTETAELVREALKRNFPGIKFSVRSSKYAGGASIDVRWVLGPSTKEADAICSQYESADFDGMIDLETYKSHWMLPDGSTIIQDATGTEGSLGVIPPEHNKAPEGAIPVHFGAHYVQCQRSLTEHWEDELKLREQAAMDMCTLNHVEWISYELTTHLYGQNDNEQVGQHAWRLLAATSFAAAESYAGVRWATEEERLKDNQDMVIVKKGAAPAAAASDQGITVRENKQFKGLEIIFPGKPDEAVIAQLKNNGWRWNHKKGLWYNHLTDQNKLFAESLMRSKEAK